MTTQSNYSLQNFGMNNARVLTGNSQPVPDFNMLSPCSAKIRASDKDLPVPTGQFFKIVSFEALKT